MLRKILHSGRSVLVKNSVAIYFWHLIIKRNQFFSGILFNTIINSVLFIIIFFKSHCNHVILCELYFYLSKNSYIILILWNSKSISFQLNLLIFWIKILVNGKSANLSMCVVLSKTWSSLQCVQHITLLIGFDDMHITEQYTRLASGGLLLSWKLKYHISRIPRREIGE